MSVLGAILSGGRSIRMGQDKAEVQLAGRSMLDRCSDSMQHVVDRVVLLGPDRAGFECWPDAIHGEGPLAGIATALDRFDGDHVFVVAVDQPLIRPETARRLIDLAADNPVVPVDREGVPQVTCAVYPTATAQTATDEARSDGSIQSFLDTVSFIPVPPPVWETWGEDGRSWFSIDTPEAIERAAIEFSL